MGLRAQMSLMLGNYKKKNFKWRRLNIASNIQACQKSPKMLLEKT